MGDATGGRALPGVTTLMFDFYGTVVDMQGSLTDAIAPLLARKGYSGDPGRLVTWWRRTHFENSMVDALLHQGHTPYREIGRQAVHYTLTRAGVRHTMDEAVALVAEIERLRPFPDVVEALTRLRTAGYRLVVLSNGDPDMLARGVPYSGTGHLFARIVSVAEAGAFKPHAVTYRTALDLLDASAEEVLFVANHAFDCVGAKAAGLRSAFVDRRRRPFGNDQYPPDLVVADFRQLADVLTAGR